jgi:pimeloyl-ACP methyl ester carboxylesterase
MPFMPFNILGIWLRGLLSLAIPILAVLCLKWWYDDSWVDERVVVVRSAVVRPAVVRAGAGPSGKVATTVQPERASEPAPADRRSAPGARESVPPAPGPGEFLFEPGWNRATAELAAAVALLVWMIAGRWIGWGLTSLLASVGRSARGSSGVKQGSPRSPEMAEVSAPAGFSDRGAISAEEPQPEAPRELRTGQVHRIRRPDGSELQVETYGPDDAPPLVLTHGWGANADEWYYQKQHLAGRFRLIAWDLAGLGFSKQPDNRDYSMEKLAADLEAVVQFVGDRPMVLVGHSIGGMMLQTYCRLFPENLGRRVAGLAVVHSSYKDPIQTVQLAPLYEALRRPVIIPLLHLTIALWPLVWLMNWLSYINGSLNRSTRQQSFAGPGTSAQADFLSRLMLKARPDVLARGMFGMMAFDESATLPTINVPTLVVIGDRDTTTVPEAGQFIARNIPGSLPVTLSPARHLGLFEYHGQFNQVLAEFAASCLATASNSVVTT